MINLLVIDDEEDLSRGLAEILCVNGYTVMTAASAEEALDLITRVTFDLVISDVCLPGRNGFAICRESRARHAGLPFIFMSGDGGAELEQDVAQAACLGALFLPKPLDLTDLLLALSRLFNSRSSVTANVAL